MRFTVKCEKQADCENLCEICGHKEEHALF